ncbi:MAG: DMT family transporter [Sphaerochaetaceae bacterium]|nr:DMT family transporter [Sphaerochaetaceae bacterium]
MSSDRSEYVKGIAFATIGIVVLSFDALFVRISQTAGFKASFWRASSACISLLIVFLIRQRGKAASVLKAGGIPMLFSGLLWGLSGISFSMGVINAGVPSTLVMMSLSPLFAAGYSFLIYRERPSWFTLIAAIGAIGGILFMFRAQLQHVLNNGLIYAVATPLFLGINLSHLRHHKNVNRMAVCMLGGLFGALLSWMLAAGDVAISRNSLAPLLVLGLAIVPFSQTMISTGTRYIPAAESALINSMETVLGILYVWIFLGEAPSHDFLIGAIVVVSCITINSIVQGRHSRLKTATL